MKPTLIDTHFQRDEAVLPGIGEKINLPHDVLFRDEGEVNSLVKSLVKTQLILSGRIMTPRGIADRVIAPIADNLAILIAQDTFLQKNPDLDLEHNLGYNFRHETDTGAVAYSIARRKGLDASQKIFTDGHESGHLIDKLGQRQVLQDMLDKRGISLDISGYLDEDFADIGGLLALWKAREGGTENITLPIFKRREAVKRVLAQPFGF